MSNEINRIYNYRRRRQESSSIPNGTDGNVPSTPYRQYKQERGFETATDSRQSKAINIYNGQDGERHNNHNPGKQQPDVSTYIVELENQNSQLRLQIANLQSSLEQDKKQFRSNSFIHDRGDLMPVVEGTKIALDNVMSNSIVKMKAFDSETDKRAFLTDVLSQIEVVVQAHKNKSAAEIQRYRGEADAARKALADLRASIQSEGMTLSLSNASLSRQNKLTNDISGASGKKELPIDLPKETTLLLESITDDILERILAVDASEDLPKAVHTEVKNSFLSLISHFSDQLVIASKDAQESLNDMKREMETMKTEFRALLHSSEEKRIQLVRDYDVEIGILRDELEAYHRASATDDMEAGIHRKVLDEYNSMLIDARQEVSDMRVTLEEEKNRCAEVCLKLKSSLQRRNAEFENTLLERTDNIFSDKMQIIRDLQSQLNVLRATKRTTMDTGTQVGEPSVLSFTSDSYITNVLKTTKKDPKSLLVSNAEYEREIWNKTKDLLSKYGK